MAIDSLKVRAEALRAEAKSARVDVASTYQSRLTDIDTDLAKTRRDGKNAEAAAKQATEDANDYAASVRVDNQQAQELDESAAKAAKRGDTKAAEEDGELAAHARQSAQRSEAQERDATLEAARYRAEAADHDVHVKELNYQVRDVNRQNNAAEQELDDLEDQARLYEEAVRKFEEADGPVNAPKRARLQREADEAIAKADAIVVDRAAIRVLAPEFPDQTPGFDATVSSAMPIDDGADPTALAFGAGDDDAVGLATPDLGLDQDGQANESSQEGTDVASTDPPVDQFASPDPGAAAAADEFGSAGSPGDSGSSVPAASSADEVTFDSPEPAFADVGAQESAFGGGDTFAQQDFAVSDAPADAVDPEPTFDDSGFA